jgi:O-antigen ligase
MSQRAYTYSSLRPFQYLDRPRSAEAGRNTRWLVPLFWAAHIPLALFVRQSATLGVIHGFGTFAVGVLWCLRARRPERAVYVAAYIASAEVLWRMTKVPIFWEYGKYATAALFILTILRCRLLKGSVLSLLYFGALIPSVALTLMNNEPSAARGQISANLSGPFALATSVFFLSQVRLTAEQLQRVFYSLLGPAIGIAFVATYGIVTATEIVFTGSSNDATSGGWGPNQVAAALGFGATIAFLGALNEKRWWLRLVFFGLMLVLAAQSALTFSRGGVYCFGGAAVASVVFFARDARTRLKIIVFILLGLGTLTFVVLPRLNDFTGGALESRFADTNSSGREEMIWVDFQIWAENPLLGVGPGEAAENRLDSIGKAAASHTEYTRLLAEHGSLGLGALLLLFVTGLLNIKRAPTAKQKGMAAALMCWSTLYMLINAMRLVMPAFAFGLCSVILLAEEGESRTHGGRPPAAGRRH